MPLSLGIFIAKLSVNTDMQKENSESILWLCLYTTEGRYGVVGIFSSEEEAMLNVPDDDKMDFWMCPLEVDVPVGSPEDKFALMPDRIYPVYAFEVEMVDEVDRPKLTIVK